MKSSTKLNLHHSIKVQLEYMQTKRLKKSYMNGLIAVPYYKWKFLKIRQNYFLNETIKIIRIKKHLKKETSSI